MQLGVDQLPLVWNALWDAGEAVPSLRIVFAVSAPGASRTCGLNAG